MTIFIIALCSVLTVTYVILPTMAYQKKRSFQRMQQDYRNFQLRAVKKYCQPLQELSYDEIKEKYNVTATYDKIGKRFDESL